MDRRKQRTNEESPSTHPHSVARRFEDLKMGGGGGERTLSTMSVAFDGLSSRMFEMTFARWSYL